MRDTWCKRLAIVAAVWLVVATAIQIVVSATLR